MRRFNIALALVLAAIMGNAVAHAVLAQETPPGHNTPVDLSALYGGQVVIGYACTTQPRAYTDYKGRTRFIRDWYVQLGECPVQPIP